MANQDFQTRHLHYQVLYEYALLEHELEIQGKMVPRLTLKEPSQLLQQIRQMRASLRGPKRASQMG